MPIPGQLCRARGSYDKTANHSSDGPAAGPPPPPPPPPLYSTVCTYTVRDQLSPERPAA